MIKKRHIIESASIIIALATGILYILGLTYYQAYLNAFGLIESQFPLTIDKLLFQGFVSAATIGAVPIVNLFLFAEVVLLISLFTSLAVSYINKNNLFTNVIVIIKNKLNKRQTEENSGNFYDFGSKIMKYSTILLIGFLGIISILITCDRAGKEYAEMYKKNIKIRLVKPLTLVLKNSNQSIAGHTIVCNQDQCAFLVLNEIIILNKSDINKTTILQ